jgi:signal transduction histidine kinase
VSESLENVVRHARVDRAVLDISEEDGRIRVTVADGGRGFDPEALPDHRFGIRQSVIGRMKAAGGSARIRSAPGQGTTIELEWRDG